VNRARDEEKKTKSRLEKGKSLKRRYIDTTPRKEGEGETKEEAKEKRGRVLVGVAD